MKTRILLIRFAVGSICATAMVKPVQADDFKSKVVPGGTVSQQLAHIAHNEILTIRNFTQEGGTSRGTVAVTTMNSQSPTDVLAAAILDSTNTTPGMEDVINSVVIAGPATVFVTCGAASGSNCFISYKKDNN